MSLPGFHFEQGGDQRRRRVLDQSMRTIKFGILELLKERGETRKFFIIGNNITGHLVPTGELEGHLRVAFSPEQRAQAGRALEELMRDGFVSPSWNLDEPEAYVEITESGRQALSRGELDELDVALREIAPHFVEIRHGAWAAAHSSQPDASRQAAHSGRELIGQILKTLAPDAEVTECEWFQHENGGRNGVTRRHRVHLVLEKCKGHASKSEIRVVEAAMDHLLAINDDLQRISHYRGATHDTGAVIEALQTVDSILRRLLIPRHAPKLEANSNEENATPASTNVI